MTRITTRPRAGRRVRASIGASVAGLVVLAGGAATAAAAPAPLVGVDDGTLRVVGSPLSDEIALRLSAADRDLLEVDFGDDGSADFSVRLDQFGAIDVSGGNGNDVVRIDQLNGAFTTTEPTRIDGGNGNDTLVGGSGAEVFFGGNGADVVDGNGGPDTGFLGNGDDVFVWDPGDASDVVEGGRGFDTLVFNGAAGNETMSVLANGGRVSFVRSPGNIVMDLDAVEAIDVRALGGADSVTVGEIGGTDLERVDVDLASALGGSAGDGLADTVTVVGTKGDDSIAVDANGAAVEVDGLAAFVRITHADPGVDTLVVDSGIGDDDVALDPALGGLIKVSVL